MVKEIILIISRGSGCFSVLLEGESFLRNKEKILAFLKEHMGFYCDDCLSINCNIFPRQTVYQQCTKLHKQGLIERRSEECRCCKKLKKSSSIINGTSDESLHIPSKEKTIKIPTVTTTMIRSKYYEPESIIKVKLNFEEFDIENVFANYNNHSLAEILTKINI